MKFIILYLNFSELFNKKQRWSLSRLNFYFPFNSSRRAERNCIYLICAKCLCIKLQSLFHLFKNKESIQKRLKFGLIERIIKNALKNFKKSHILSKGNCPCIIFLNCLYIYCLKLLKEAFHADQKFIIRLSSA